MGGICIICLRKREGKVRENLHKASTSSARLIKRIQTTTKPQTTSKPHTTSHHSTRHQYASKTSIPFTREDPETPAAAADPAEPPPSSTQRTPAAENNPHKLPRREEHSRVESRRGERQGCRPTSRASVWNLESRSFPFQDAFDKTEKRGRTLEIPETVVYERL